MLAVGLLGMSYICVPVKMAVGHGLRLQTSPSSNFDQAQG